MATRDMLSMSPHNITVIETVGEDVVCCRKPNCLSAIAVSARRNSYYGGGMVQKCVVNIVSCGYTIEEGWTYVCEGCAVRLGVFW